MSYLALNLVLALLWMFMWGAYDVYTFLAGMVLAYLLLGLGARIAGHDYGRRVMQLFSFAGYFLKILFQANWQVAKIVLNPALPLAPRIMRYDVNGMTPVQIATLVNSITLTPGTLVVDIDIDGKRLYIHALNAPDREAAEREIDELRTRLLKEVFAE